MPAWITDNPTAWLGFVGAVIALAIAFGVHVTPDQVQAVVGFFAALFVLFGAIGHATTVPKTPSASAPPSAIQEPKPASQNPGGGI